MQGIWSYLARSQGDQKSLTSKTKFDDAIVTRIYEGKLQLRDALKQPIKDVASFKQSVVKMFEDCHEEFDQPSLPAGKDTVTLMDVSKEFCKFWAEKEKEVSLSSKKKTKYIGAHSAGKSRHSAAGR